MTGASGTERLETVIVGGGQAGLAVGYHLARRDRRFVILDANRRVGDAWRQRWDSLRLFTPARYSGLPGMPFPAPSSPEAACWWWAPATPAPRSPSKSRAPIRPGCLAETPATSRSAPAAGGTGC